MPVTRVKFRAGGGKEPRENQLWFKLGRIINFFYRVKLARVPPESKLSWGPPSHFSLNLYTPPPILNFGSPAGAILPRGLRYLAPGTLEDRLIISIYRAPPPEIGLRAHTPRINLEHIGLIPAGGHWLAPQTLY